MRVIERFLRDGAIIGALLACGCASTTAPRGWLPKPKGTESDAFGCWIEVWVNGGSGIRSIDGSLASPSIDGELVTVDSDSIFVLTPTGLAGVACHDVDRAQATRYRSQAGDALGWTLAGTISTVSHGWFAFATAPIWIIAGTIGAIAATHEPSVQYPRRSWEHFKPFARFPAGWPAGIDRGSLQPKPVPPASPRRGW